MITYSSLENIDIEKLHFTFIEAFSDYEVKLDMPISKLFQTLQRRGYVKKASICASKDGRLVGFLLNSIRYWDKKLTAYDTGTGVIKEYRNRGLSSTMFSNSLHSLKQMEIKQYLLEVIQSNEPAIHLYKKQGFKISREFECFSLDKKLSTHLFTYEIENIDSITKNDWIRLIDFWDFKPSWQNSIDSINALQDTFIYSIVKIDDVIVGYGIIDKETGDIPQIAVDKNYRSIGIGTSIIAELLLNTKSHNINIVNVDSKCTSMKRFLLKLGFKVMLKQYEMVLELS